MVEEISRLIFFLYIYKVLFIPTFISFFSGKSIYNLYAKKYNFFFLKNDFALGK
ncbi:hypothetical protein GLOIN_2v1707480, partial [Rhizophagus irregularis DAOM 181602=DAOM 197198]